MEEFAGEDILMACMVDPTTPFISRQGLLILDGGLATELERRGADLNDPLWSARLLLEEPELIRRVHLDYLTAGADCVVSASYQATFEGFARRGLDTRETASLLRLSVDLAMQAREEFLVRLGDSGTRLRPLVAASIGPYGAFLADGSEYRGDYGLSDDELETFHRRRLTVLETSGADLLAVETIPSRDEALAIARLLDSTDGIAAWMSFSCRDERSLCDGTPLDRVVAQIDDCSRIIAVGVNCTAPKLVSGLLREAAKVTDKPLVAYPNTGEGYDAAGKRWLAAEERFSLVRSCAEWKQSGALLIGGCCRTRPSDIKSLREALL